MRRAISSASGAAGQGAAGDDPDGIVGERGDFVAAQFDQRFGRDGGGDFAGEHVAIDGERMTAGDAGLLRALREAASRGGAVPL